MDSLFGGGEPQVKIEPGMDQSDDVASPSAPPQRKKSKPIPDASSGEEERKSKTKSRTKRPKPSRKIPELGDLPPGMFLVESDGFPEISDLKELVVDNPHMCMDMSKPDRCVGVKAEEPAPDAVDESKQVVLSLLENPLSRPLEYTEVQTRVDAYPVVHPVVTEGQEWKLTDKVRLVRQQKFYLPLYLASFESEILCAAGSWKHTNGRVYDFPACGRGAECVGLTVRDIKFVDSKEPEEFKFPLTCSMLRRDYERFLMDGTPPSTRQPCIGCLRKMSIDAVAALRGTRAMRKGDKDREVVLDEKTLLQSHRNLMDREGGYHREYCLMPSDEKWEGIVSPIPPFRASMLVARRTRFKRPYIDQSALVWKASVVSKPDIGESIQNFSPGVSS